MLNKTYEEVGCTMADEFLSAYIMPMIQQEASEERWMDVSAKCFYVLTSKTGDWLCLDFVVPGLYRQSFKVGCDDSNFMGYSRKYYEMRYEYIGLSSDEKIAKALEYENTKFKEALNSIFCYVFKSTFGCLYADGDEECDYDFAFMVPTKYLFCRFALILDIALPIQKQFRIGLSVDENNPNGEAITEEIRQRIEDDGHFAELDPLKENFKAELPF